MFLLKLLIGSKRAGSTILLTWSAQWWLTIFPVTNVSLVTFSGLLKELPRHLSICVRLCVDSWFFSLVVQAAENVEHVPLRTPPVSVKVYRLCLYWSHAMC